MSLLRIIVFQVLTVFEVKGVRLDLVYQDSREQQKSQELHDSNELAQVEDQNYSINQLMCVIQLRQYTRNLGNSNDH